MMLKHFGTVVWDSWRSDKAVLKEMGRKVE